MRQPSPAATTLIETLGRRLNRELVGELMACTHCGNCASACHLALTHPGDPTMVPAYKADRVRQLFRRHHEPSGKLFRGWIAAGSVSSDRDLEELRDVVFGKCNNCSRCTASCPMGIDNAAINRTARGLLAAVGVTPRGIEAASRAQREVGNQMGIGREEYLETLGWLSEQLVDEFGDPRAAISVDEPDCDLVYAVNPREIKYDPRTLLDAAAVFYLAEERWTMSSAGWDMTNFGLFSGDDELGALVARRVYESAIRLRGKRLVLSECGHGYRATRCEAINWGGAVPPIPMEHMVSAMLRYVEQGRIAVDRSRNREPVTYHDSCNLARGCGMTEEPRQLLARVVTDFREMTPNRTANFCCTGGGGAMSMAEYTPIRLRSARIKAEQLRATGARLVATSCHNCVDGLSDVIRHYRLGMDVVQLVTLVGRAVVRDRPQPAAADR